MVVLELLLIACQNLQKNIEFPGILTLLNQTPLVPEKYFPQFDMKLQPTDFRIGDDIQMIDSSGTVVKGSLCLEQFK